MCFNVDIRSASIDHIARYIGVDLAMKIAAHRLASGTMMSAFSHPDLPLLLSGHGSWLEDLETFPAPGGLTSTLGTWGLVPSWAKDQEQIKKIRTKTLNARSETAESLPSFRDSCKLGHCVVVVSGFYETRHEEDGSRQVYRLGLPDNQALLLAGLFARHEGRAGASLLTGPARGIMAWVHNTALRQVLVLEPQELEPWLHAKDLGPLEAAQNRSPELTLEPFGPPKPASKRTGSPKSPLQGELF